jgi:hypothetical protein
MTATEIEQDAFKRIRKIVRDNSQRDITASDTKRIASALRDIAFQAEVAAQEIEGMTK